MSSLATIIEKYKRCLADFANCDKNLNGDMTEKAQREIFYKFQDILFELVQLKSRLEKE